MIGHITLGSNDVDKSAAFYQKLFDLLGARRIYDYPNYVAWQKEPGSPMFSITKPYDNQSATVGNGTMIALEAESVDRVKLVYELAISLGALDEGAPGHRAGGFYCGYFRDPDGNKLNVFKFDKP